MSRFRVIGDENSCPSGDRKARTAASAHIPGQSACRPRAQNAGILSARGEGASSSCPHRQGKQHRGDQNGYESETAAQTSSSCFQQSTLQSGGHPALGQPRPMPFSLSQLGGSENPKREQRDAPNPPPWGDSVHPRSRVTNCFGMRALLSRVNGCTCRSGPSARRTWLQPGEWNRGEWRV
jgi:hypothetical protein